MFNYVARRLVTRPQRFMMVQPRMLTALQCRGYFRDGGLMPREQGQYYADPKNVAERVVRLIALHDNVKDPAAVVPGSTFAELGLNALDMCEIYIGIEREFDLEISEEDCEAMETVNELIEFLSKHPATK